MVAFSQCLGRVAFFSGFFIKLLIENRIVNHENSPFYHPLTASYIKHFPNSWAGSAAPIHLRIHTRDGKSPVNSAPPAPFFHLRSFARACKLCHPIKCDRFSYSPRARDSGGDNGSGGADDADDENLSIVSSHTLTNETTGGVSSSVSPKDTSGVTATTLTTTSTMAADGSGVVTLKRHPKHRHHLPVVRHSTATASTTVVTDTDDALLSDAEPVSPNTLGSCSPDDADESSPTSSCSPPRPSDSSRPSAHHHHHSISSLPATTSASPAPAASATATATTATVASLPVRKWLRDKRHNATGTPRLAGATRRSGGDAETQSNNGSVGGVGGGRSRKLSVGSAAMLRSSREAMGSPNLTDTEGSSLLRTRRLKKLHVSFTDIIHIVYYLMLCFFNWVSELCLQIHLNEDCLLTICPLSNDKCSYF